MSVGIVLYGAPATGKDTVTAALVAQDATFQLYERIKCGPGRTAGYRMVSLAEFQRLSLAGDFIWTNERYNAHYAIDRAGLEQQLTDGSVPVVHAGQPEVIDAVRNGMPHVQWFVVQLVCSRDTAQTRIIARSTGDTTARLAAWDATPRLQADLTIDTDSTPPEATARAIRSLIEAHDQSDS